MTIQELKELLPSWIEVFRRNGIIFKESTEAGTIKTVARSLGFTEQRIQKLVKEINELISPK